jgi:hypothetical protein
MDLLALTRRRTLVGMVMLTPFPADVGRCAKWAAPVLAVRTE